MHIPLIRLGEPYESVDHATLAHHAGNEIVASVSQANSGLIARDIQRMSPASLQGIPVRELLAICRRAARRFITGDLPAGDQPQSFDEYITSLSATTGMPITYCRANAEKIHLVLHDMEAVLAGLTRGLDLDSFDREYVETESGVVSHARTARVFGAVLPSNSPGVHTLWLPAIAMKTPVVLKPGREEPWTPLRVIQAFIAAGAPRDAFGFYPTDHGGASELLRRADRSMLFGDASTTRPWANNPRVQLHGPGFSKIILGPDAAEDWREYVDVMASSIAANGGRSCLNTSGIWTPAHGAEIADAIAEQFAKVTALPADDPRASVAAFANPAVAEHTSAVIDRDLLEPGANDPTTKRRGAPRLARIGRCAYLLSTVIHCESPEHPLANREFLFPFASVVDCPASELFERIGDTLVGTVISRDAAFIDRAMRCGHINRLNIGPVPTWRIRWDQPHEGNLFDHLYRRRALHVEPVPP